MITAASGEVGLLPLILALNQEKGVLNLSLVTWDCAYFWKPYRNSKLK